MITVPILETKRLILRPWRLEDADALFAYSRDPSVGPNAGWKPHESVEESRALLEAWVREENDLLWAITEKGNDFPIGSVGLHVDQRRPRVQNYRELGYVLSRESWGKGIMTEAARAVLAWGFEELGLALISCGHFTFNDRSRRVIEKCGFTYEGTLRMGYAIYDGTVVDEAVYSITAGEYRNLKEQWRDEG